MYSEEIIIYLLASCLKMQFTILKLYIEVGLILSFFSVHFFLQGKQIRVRNSLKPTKMLSLDVILLKTRKYYI